MSIEASLFAYLQSRPTITALVGNRIFPQAAAQGSATPYIVYSLLNDQPIQHAGGSSTLARKAFTLTVFASSAAQARAVSNAIRLELDGLSNYTPPGGTTIRSAHRDGERALISPDADGSQSHSYQLDTDYRLFHIYPAPNVPTP